MILKIGYLHSERTNLHFRFNPNRSLEIYKNAISKDRFGFNAIERKKQSAADRRWMKAADTRPLYKKDSPNNDIPR